MKYITCFFKYQEHYFPEFQRQHEKNLKCCVKYRVNSGNFGHQVNSDIRSQTVEIQMRRLIMSYLIFSFQ